MTLIDPPPPALPDYLNGLVDQLAAHVQGVLQTEQIESVHQARVATRRLRAATELLKPILPRKSRRLFNRALRRVRRRLGPVRDIDVMVGHLHELANEPACEPAAVWLIEQFEHDRLECIDRARTDRALLRLNERLAPWGRIALRIREHSDAIDSLLGESLHQQIDRFAARADELCGPPNHDVDPHAVRIAGKALRYTVEMAQVHGHPLSDELTKSFKKMQDALGLWHDHVVLTERAMLLSAQCMLAHHHPTLQQSVLDVASASLREATRQLDKFRERWREDGMGLSAAIRAAFPLSRDVADASETRTDHDPDRSPAPAVAEGPH